MKEKTVSEVFEEINYQISTSEAVEIIETFYEAFICLSDDNTPQKSKLYDSYQLKKLLQELLIIAQKEYKFKS